MVKKSLDPLSVKRISAGCSLSGLNGYKVLFLLMISSDTLSNEDLEVVAFNGLLVNLENKTFYSIYIL